MAMTSNYIVLMVWPSVLDPMALAMGRSVLATMSWQPQLGVIYHVIDKHAPEDKGWVATYTCVTTAVLHAHTHPHGDGAGRMRFSASTTSTPLSKGTTS